jgi:hypothetical protein
MNLPSKSQEPVEKTIWEKLREDCRAEQEHAQKELRGIILLIEQSQLETSKIQQRNASVSANSSKFKARLITYQKAIYARLTIRPGCPTKIICHEGSDSISYKVTKPELSIFWGYWARKSSFGCEEISSSGQTKDQSAVGKSIEMIIQAQEERRRLSANA